MPGRRSRKGRKKSGTKGPFQSAITGRFVTKKHAKRNPRTTFGRRK